MFKIISGIIVSLVFYIDFKPEYDFRNDVSAFIIIRIDSSKKDDNKLKLNNIVFNILSFKI